MTERIPKNIGYDDPQRIPTALECVITHKEIMCDLGGVGSGFGNGWAVMEIPPLETLEISLRKAVGNFIDEDIWIRIKPTVEAFLEARREFLSLIDASSIFRFDDDAIEYMLEILPQYLKTYEDLLSDVTQLCENRDYAEDIYASGLVEIIVNADFMADEDVTDDSSADCPKPFFFAPIMLYHFMSADRIRRSFNQLMQEHPDNFALWLRKLAYANIRQSFIFATRHQEKTYRYKLGVKEEPTSDREVNSEIHVANLSRHIASEFWTQYRDVKVERVGSETHEFKVALIGVVEENDLRQLVESVAQDFRTLESKKPVRISLTVYTGNDLENLVMQFDGVSDVVSVERKPEIKKQESEISFDNLEGLENELLRNKYNLVLFFDNTAFYKVRTLTTEDLREYNSRIYQDSQREGYLWIMRTTLMQYEAHGEYGFAKCRRFNNQLFKQIRKMAGRIHKYCGSAVYLVLSGSDCNSFMFECPDIYQEFAVSDEWDMATRVAVLRVSPNGNRKPVVLNPDVKCKKIDYTTLKLSPSQIFRRMIEPGQYHELFQDGIFDRDAKLVDTEKTELSDIEKSDEALKLLKNTIIQLNYSEIQNEAEGKARFALFDLHGNPPRRITEETGDSERELISLVKSFLGAALSPYACGAVGPCNISDVFTSAVMRYATRISAAVFLYFYEAGTIRRSPVLVEYDEGMEYNPGILGPDRRAEIAAGGDIYALDGAMRTLAIPGYDFRHEVLVKTVLKRALSDTTREGDVDIVYNWMRDEVAESCSELGLSEYTLYWNARK